jgi:hypothetical protein
MRADERGKVAPGMARTAQEADRGRQILGAVEKRLEYQPVCSERGQSVGWPADSVGSATGVVQVMDLRHHLR